MWTRFRNKYVYGRLAFAEPAESIRLARQALKIKPDDAVVGITSSGDILLSFLADRPASIRGFDANPTQTALAQLKHTLCHEVSLDHSLGFLGLAQLSAHERVATWSTLKQYMGPHAIHLESLKIKKGLLNTGVSIKLTRYVFAMLRYLAGPKDFARLIAPETTASQRLEIFDKIKSRKRYRYCARPLLHSGSELFQHFFFPPGLCANSDYPKRALKDLLGYFERLFEVGFHRNPVFHRHLTGDIPDEQVEHIYSPTAWKTIKESDSYVSFETCSLEDGFFELKKNSTDAFYLSNAPDYFRSDRLHRLAQALEHAAKPGARVYYLSLDSNCPFDRCHIDMPFQHLESDERDLRNADSVGLYPYLGVLVRE